MAMPADTTGKAVQVLDLMLDFLLKTTTGHEGDITTPTAATALSARCFIPVQGMGFYVRR
jgi:hypothetical protein